MWAWDFVADYTQRGGKLRVFTLIDEYTRESHVLHSDRSIGSLDIMAVVEEMVARHVAPRFIRSDNGPEFIATAIQRWLREKKSAPFISIQVAPDRMVLQRASTAGCVSNAWTAR